MSTGYRNTTVDSDALVTVVTPAYNEANRGFLTKTLDSVSRQTYPRVEHVVVDDGSTDDTAALVDDYDHEHDVVLIRQDNRGMAHAVNRGIGASEGDVIVWLNGDDVLAKTNTLSRVVEAFERNPSTDFVYGHTVHIGRDGALRSVQVPHPMANFDRLVLNNFGVFVFLNGDTLRSLELNPEYRHSPDYELYLRGADNGASFTYVREPLYGHRHHDDRKSDQVFSEMQAESERIRDEYGTDRNARFRARRFLLYKQLDLLQALGVPDVWEVHKHPNRYAGDIAVESVREAVRNQLRATVPV